MTKYNLFFKTAYDTFNILDLSNEKLEKVISHYKNGQTEFTIGGKKYWIGNLYELKIFQVNDGIDSTKVKEYLVKSDSAEHRSGGGYYLGPKMLGEFGVDVTDEILGDSEFGENSIKEKKKESVKNFVEETRIKELKEIKTPSYDLTRLIGFCEEINFNYSNEKYLSVAMLGRSIINHIPPIFDFKTFNEVVNNYGGQSFRKIMGHLHVTMRSIADSFLHDTIRKKESLPNSTQVNFSQDLDVLLAEIIRKLNEEKLK